MVLLAVLPILGIAIAFSRSSTGPSATSARATPGSAARWARGSASSAAGSTWPGTTIYLAYGSQVCGSMLLTFANECHWHSVLRSVP